MIPFKKSEQGFTVIELLIVIAVVIILGLLVWAGYGGIQAKERNKERAKDIAAIQTQLEFFFQNNGYYPSLKDMNDPAWLNKNMKHLDKGNLVDPLNPRGSKELISSPAAKSYAYAVRNSSGKSCEADDTTCSQYKLTATYEGNVNGSTTVSEINQD
ncbi:MAG: type II secretion system protein [Candidatus Saccharimonadales bacterium]